MVIRVRLLQNLVVVDGQTEVGYINLPEGWDFEVPTWDDGKTLVDAGKAEWITHPPGDIE